MGEGADCIVGAAPNRRRVGEWELVLASAALPYRVQRDGQRWLLVVAAEDASAATAAIAAFERENATPGPAVPLFEYGPTRAAVAAVAVLVAFHLLSLYVGPEWVRRGRASALWILDGQLWRTVTALTLHSGAAHLLGNAVAGVILGSFVCRAFGPGLGIFLMLFAGAAGNFANAVVRAGAHHAVGASTAIFGGVGLLVALQFVRRVRTEETPGRAWLPIAAGVALLGMLGGAEGSDLLAHLFGFLVGVPCGVAACTVLPRPPSLPAQRLWASAAVATLVISWALAWR